MKKSLFFHDSISLTKLIKMSKGDEKPNQSGHLYLELINSIDWIRWN